MTRSSEGPNRALRALLRMSGLDEGWTVRFTADENRAREMADAYRAAGFEVRVLPLYGGREGSHLVTLSGAGREASDSPTGDETGGCMACFRQTFVVLTRPGSSGDTGTGLQYE